MKPKYRFEGKLYPEGCEMYSDTDGACGFYLAECINMPCHDCGLDRDEERFARFKTYLAPMPPVHKLETEPRDHLRYEYRAEKAVIIGGFWECLQTTKSISSDPMFRGIGAWNRFNMSEMFRGLELEEHENCIYRRPHPETSTEEAKPAFKATPLPPLRHTIKGKRQEWKRHYTRVYEIAARQAEQIKVLTERDRQSEKDNAWTRGDRDRKQADIDDLNVLVSQFEETERLNNDTILELNERLTKAEALLEASIRLQVIKEIKHLADTVEAGQ